MTLAQALAELGVERDVDPEALRRAYLRLIKTRKPETDPDGFQRAREAYEVARRAHALDDFVAAHAAEAPVPSGMPLPTSDEQSLPPAPAGDHWSAGPPPASTTPGAADAAFEGFARAFHDVPPSTGQHTRIEIAHEAVAALPRDPRAHWLLIAALTGWTTDIGLADAIRTAYRTFGKPEFLRALLTRAPRRVLPDELEAAFTSEHISLRLAAAAAAVPINPERSAAVVVRLCEEARTNGHVELPFGPILDTVLALYAAGEFERAEKAHRALADWLHDSGFELTLAQGPLGGLWTLTEELARLPRDFPPELRRVFAAATRRGDLATAFSDACAFVDRKRKVAKLWVDRMGTTAPNIVDTLRSAIAHDTVRRKALRRSRLGLFRYSFAMPLALLLFHFCFDSSPPARRYVHQPDAILGVKRPSRGRGIRVAASTFCDGTRPTIAIFPCPAVRSFALALDMSDCRGSEYYLRMIRAVLGARASGEAESIFLTTCGLAAEDVCRSPGSPSPSENNP